MLVEAHSGHQFNGLADTIAKEGCLLAPITINPKCLPTGLMTPMWDNIGTIEKDLRKFCKISPTQQQNVTTFVWTS